MVRKLAFLLSLACAVGATTAMAQDANLEKLGGFKTTGTPMMVPIPQTGENADALKAIAAKIKVPEGFKVSLYAVVPDARHMAVGPQGVVTFVGTRKELAYSVTDRNKDRVADDVKVFAPSIKMALPSFPRRRTSPVRRRATSSAPSRPSSRASARARRCRW